MCTVHRTVVLLRNLVDREVADINVGGQFRFKRCSNFPQLVPEDTTEERMFLDLRCSVVSSTFFAQSVIGVTQEAVPVSLDLS